MKSKRARSIYGTLSVCGFVNKSYAPGGACTSVDAIRLLFDSYSKVGGGSAVARVSATNGSKQYFVVDAQGVYGDAHIIATCTVVLCLEPGLLCCRQQTCHAKCGRLY